MANGPLVFTTPMVDMVHIALQKNKQANKQTNKQTENKTKTNSPMTIFPVKNKASIFR